MPTCKLAAGICALVAVALGAPASAAASTSSFGCRASAVRAAFAPPGSTVEPTVANGATSPCSGVSTTSPGTTSGSLHVGASAAFTHVNASFQGRGAGSFGYVSDVAIESPSGQILIASAQAQASSACNDHTLLTTSASQVAGLVIDGKPISDTVRTVEIPVGALGSYIVLNQTSTTPTALTRTAAFVHLVGVGDFVLGEATVSHTSSACASKKAPSAIVDPCPVGSSYDPVTVGCLITAGTKKPIRLGAPFQGPAGGQVLALGSVHLKSPCLRGTGPRYVVIAAPGAGLVTGTSGADRIFALSGNYEIKARGGGDCIDVTGGTDVVRDGDGNDRILTGQGSATIYAGNGNDRVFAGPGRDKISAGRGNDVIHAGPGVDVISAGNGTDHVYGAPGYDKISVGNGNDTIIGALGFDRIAAGNGTDLIRGGPGLAKISAGTGADVILGSLGHAQIRALGNGAHVSCAPGALVSLAPGAVHFATKHGCKAVTVL